MGTPAQLTSTAIESKLSSWKETKSGGVPGLCLFPHPCRDGQLMERMCLHYLLPGVWQPGKKVLPTILEVCPLVTLLLGRK